MRRIAVAAAALALLALAGPASAATFRGTVVHRHGHTLVVAKRTGRMVAIHSSRAVRVGRVVRVSGSHIRVLGRSRHARLRGTVTYVNRHRRVFTLSSRGVSLLVHRRSAKAARAAGDDLPSSGSQVTVNADMDDNGDVNATQVKDDGDDEDGVDLEGKVQAIDTTARTLTLSADDCDESHDSVVVHVPDSFDLNQFKVGNEVELVVTKESDGTFTLQKVDDNQADDDQGDGDHHDNNAKNDDDNGDDNGGGGDD